MEYLTSVLSAVSTTSYSVSAAGLSLSVSCRPPARMPEFVTNAFRRPLIGAVFLPQVSRFYYYYLRLTSLYQNVYTYAVPTQPLSNIVEPVAVRDTFAHSHKVSHLPSSQCNDQVHHHEQHSLQPVRFAVHNEVVDLLTLALYNNNDTMDTHQKNRHKQQNDLKPVKVQRHVLHPYSGQFPSVAPS